MRRLLNSGGTRHSFNSEPRRRLSRCLLCGASASGSVCLAPLRQPRAAAALVITAGGASAACTPPTNPLKPLSGLCAVVRGSEPGNAHTHTHALGWWVWGLPVQDKWCCAQEPLFPQSPLTKFRERVLCVASRYLSRLGGVGQGTMSEGCTRRQAETLRCGEGTLALSNTRGGSNSEHSRYILSKVSYSVTPGLRSFAFRSVSHQKTLDGMPKIANAGNYSDLVSTVVVLVCRTPRRLIEFPSILDARTHKELLEASAERVHDKTHHFFCLGLCAQMSKQMPRCTPLWSCRAQFCVCTRYPPNGDWYGPCRLAVQCDS